MMVPIDPTEVTPERVFMNRRRFMQLAGAAFAGLLLDACARRAAPTVAPTSPADVTPSQAVATPTEPDDQLTSYESITGYTNYYEFSLDKENVEVYTTKFVTSPWQVTVGGMVNTPTTFTLDDLLQLGQEERVYRMRCVEGWSMVIPWVGFPLKRLLDRVGPTAEAKFVRFETPYLPEQMPGQQGGGFSWPYVEGLRLDEAQHDLTLLATGIYGQPLTKQNGAPIRLVAPWKYGFKSIKSVFKIDLVAEMPTSFWMASSPSEYGFYANVNPDVRHPRWSQASERRIGEAGRRETLLFNGYADEVASLYEGMDLKEFF